MNGDLISREALKKALKSSCDLCNDKNTNWCEHCCPLNDFEDLIDNAPTVEVDEMTQDLINKVNVNIGLAKPIKDERPQGEWLVKSNGTTNYYACDKCGSAGDIQDKFCRECGADMRKGGKEE